MCSFWLCIRCSKALTLHSPLVRLGRWIEAILEDCEQPQKAIFVVRRQKPNECIFSTVWKTRGKNLAQGQQEAVVLLNKKVLHQDEELKRKGETDKPYEGMNHQNKEEQRKHHLNTLLEMTWWDGSLKMFSRVSEMVLRDGFWRFFCSLVHTTCLLAHPALTAP